MAASPPREGGPRMAQLDENPLGQGLRRCEFQSLVRKIPWRKSGNPLPVLPEKSTDRGACGPFIVPRSLKVDQ